MKINLKINQSSRLDAHVSVSTWINDLYTFSQPLQMNWIQRWLKKL